MSVRPRQRRRRAPGPFAEATGAPEARATAVAAGRASRFGRVLTFDEWLLVRVCRFQGPWRTRIARALTHLGDARSWTLIGLGMASTGRSGLRLGLRLGAGAIAATVLSQALKRRLGRARPTRAIEGFAALAENPDAFSFPSGHTSAAVAVAVALAGEPHGLGPASLLLAAGIGLSRVYLGAHYPLDVAAGAALGGVAGFGARLLVP